MRAHELLRKNELTHERRLENAGYGFGDPFGGKNDAPAPDYTPLASASSEAAQVAKDLGNAQIAESKRQYDLNYATLKPMVDESLKTQKMANDQGAINFAALQNEGRPVQQTMRDIAMGGDFTAAQKARQEEAATQAVADSRSGTNQQMQQLIRQGLRFGWSPAKLASMGGQAALMGAQTQVAAANGARAQKQTQQWGQMGDVYNTYAGLGSSAPAFYNSGTSAGTAGANAALGNSGQLLNGMQQGNGTIMQGQGLRLSGLGGVLNAQTNYAAASMNQGSPFMGLMGAALGGWASSGFKGLGS